MSNPDQILIRRLSVKQQTVKKGLFSKETKFALDGAMCDGERLFRVRADNGVEMLDAENLPYVEGLRIFAVQCDSFTLSFLIDLGRERDNYRWDLSLEGKARITNPIAFLHEYYSDAKDAPFTVKSFVDALGTRPGNLLLDRVLHESMGVLSIDDLNVDVAQWTKERNLTEDAFTNALREKEGTPFGKNGTVDFTVNAVRFFSEEREQRERELKQAELEAQKKKLQGGDTESAFAAFEMISNVLGDAISKSGASPFADILKDARRMESGLRLLALVRDKKSAGGVALSKNAPSFQTRSLSFASKKTPVLHHGESLSSTIACGRGDGCLTVLNVSERNEVIPMLPNADFPSVRVARGKDVLIGDDASDYIRGISENASSGTDHLIAIVSDAPLLAAPLPALGEALPAETASELVSKLATMDSGEWAADVISFAILP